MYVYIRMCVHLYTYYTCIHPSIFVYIRMHRLRVCVCVSASMYVYTSCYIFIWSEIQNHTSGCDKDQSRTDHANNVLVNHLAENCFYNTTFVVQYCGASR